MQALFAVLLIALALLSLLNIATLTLTIDVLRSLCRFLFRLLIAIRAARLLIHLVFIFDSFSSLELT